MLIGADLSFFLSENDKLTEKIIGNDNKHLTYQLEQHLGKVSVAPARAKAETANS